MVTINSLRINEAADAIDVDVVTSSGNTITQLLVWDSKTFKNVPQAIDLSSLLDGSDETEVFSIPASALSLTNFSGLFFLEFTSSEVIGTDECVGDTNVALGVVSNFIKYHECLLNKTLEIQDIKGCKQVVSDCADCRDDVLLLSALMNSLNSAIQFGFYEEAARITETIDDMCDSCHNCPDYSNVKLVSGLGYGTYDNSVILI